jgi:hypothetical protein
MLAFFGKSALQPRPSGLATDPQHRRTFTWLNRLAAVILREGIVIWKSRERSGTADSKAEAPEEEETWPIDDENFIELCGEIQ